MAADPVGIVLGQARRILLPDADLELVSFVEGALRVKLVPAELPDCEMCAISPDDLAAFLQDLLDVQGVAVQSVVVVT